MRFLIWLLVFLSCSPDYGMNTEEYTSVSGQFAVDTGTAGHIALEIVLIVDVSGSMGEEIVNLREKTLPAAFDNLMKRDELDWRIIIRRADENDFTNLGEVSFADLNPQAKLDDLMEDLVVVSSPSGGIYEAGLGTAIMSMQMDNLREDSDVVFWVVSDEDDHSYYTTVESYQIAEKQFRLTPYSTYMTVIAYGNEKDWWCSSEKNNQIAEKYEEVAGYMLSLCEPERWTDAVSVAADNAEDMNLKFRLSHLPADPSKIEVYLDSVQIQEYYWDETQMSIIFDRAPYPGTKILVAYMFYGGDTGEEDSAK